jgi:hypothetical protein
MLKPTRNWRERFRRKDPPFYGDIENVFDALKINPPQENPRQQAYASTGLYNYFVIFTRVGVGDYGKNRIENIHIRFQLQPSSREISSPYVYMIAPSSQSRVKT